MRELRDVKAWKDLGLEWSTVSDQAVKSYDHALNQLMCHTADTQTGGIAGAIKEMQSHDENFAMSYVLDVCLMGGMIRTDESAREGEKKIQSLLSAGGLNRREILHCKAAIALANERQNEAKTYWDEVMFNYPKDRLAIKLSYFNHLYLGESTSMRDCMARVLPQWEQSDVDYGYLLNMRAFGLEESGNVHEAQKVLDKGLSLQPADAWGIHTQEHIYDTLAMPKAGLEAMQKGSVWNDPDNNSLTCHITWHWTNYLIEEQRYEEALTLFDDKIVQIYRSSGAFFNLNDAVQILQRLEFDGVEVGVERWNDLYSYYKTYADRHDWVYNDLHLYNAYLRGKSARDDNAANRFRESVDGNKSWEGVMRANVREVGEPLMDAMQDYHEGRFNDAARKFYALKNQVYRVGGSNSQRDFFAQYLLSSCMQSDDKNVQAMGRAIAHERKAIYLTSPLTDRFLNRMLACHV